MVIYHDEPDMSIRLIIDASILDGVNSQIAYLNKKRRIALTSSSVRAQNTSHGSTA